MKKFIYGIVPLVLWSWRFNNQSAVRQGKWKLVKIDGETALYNLSTDI